MVRVPEVSKESQFESCMPSEITDAFRQDGRVWIPRCSEQSWGTIVCPVLLDGVVTSSSSDTTPIDCSKLTSLLPLLFEKLLGSEASGGSTASGISQPVINVDSSKTEAGSLHVTVALGSRPALSASELFEVETPLGPMTLRIIGLQDSIENINLDNEDFKEGEEEQPRVLLLDIPGEWLESPLLEEAYCALMVDVDDVLPGYSTPTRWRSWLAQFGSLKQLRVSAHTTGADGHVHLIAEYDEVSSRRACEKALGAGHLIAVKDSGGVPATFPRVCSELKSDYESRARVAWSRLVLLEAEISQADRALVAEEAGKALPSGPAGRCLTPLVSLLVAWIERGILNATETLRTQLRLQEEKGLSRGAPTDLYRHACWDAALHAALRLPRDSFASDSDRLALVLCEHWRDAYGICADPDEEDIGALVIALQAVTEARGREERELFETAEAEARSAEEALLQALEEEEGRSQKSRERLEKKKQKEREKRKERMQEQKLERQREEERQQALRQAAREQKEKEEEQKRKEREQLQAAEAQNPPRSPSKKSPKPGPKHNATDSPQLDLSKSPKNAATDSPKGCELHPETETTEETPKEPVQETQSSSSGSPRLSGQPEEEPMPATPSRTGSGVSSSSNVSQKNHKFQTQPNTSGYPLVSAATGTQDPANVKTQPEAHSSTPTKSANLSLPATVVPRRERWSDEVEVITPPADALPRQVQQNEGRSKRGPLFDAAMKQAVSSSSNMQQKQYNAADEVLEAVRKSDEMNRRHQYPPAVLQPQQQKQQQAVVVKPPAQPIHSASSQRQPGHSTNAVSGNMWLSPTKAAVQQPMNEQAMQPQAEASPTAVPPSPSRRRRGGRRRGQAASDISTTSGDTSSTMMSAGDLSPREKQEFRSPNAAITWKDLGGDVMNPMVPVRQVPQARWMPQPFGVIEDQHLATQPPNPMLGWSCAAGPPAPAPPPPPPPAQSEWPHCPDMPSPLGYAADPHWHMNCGDSQMLSSPMACSSSPMALGCVTSQMGYASSSPMACQPGSSPMSYAQSPMSCQQPVPLMPAMNCVGASPTNYSSQGDAHYQWLAGEAASATPMDLAAQLAAVASTVYED